MLSEVTARFFCIHFYKHSQCLRGVVVSTTWKQVLNNLGHVSPINEITVTPGVDMALGSQLYNAVGLVAEYGSKQVRTA